MQVRLSKPELEQFVTDQVQAGRFPSPQAAVEAAVERMMRDEVELDDETVQAINRAEEQLDRNGGIEFSQFADAMRQKMGAK